MDDTLRMLGTGVDGPHAVHDPPIELILPHGGNPLHLRKLANQLRMETPDSPVAKALDEAAAAIERLVREARVLVEEKTYPAVQAGRDK